MPPDLKTPVAPAETSAADTSETPKTWRVGTLVYTSSGLVALFAALLFGDFAWSMRDRSVTPMAAWYLKELGVGNLLFALIVSSFPALLGILFVPVVAVHSDRHRGPRGRRIPFLLITTPIAAAGMIGIAFTPYLARYVHAYFPTAEETTVAILCFGVFWALFEFASVAGHALFNGLINDIVPREMLGRFFGLFRAISLIDGIIFNTWLMGLIPTHFTLILASIGAFYGIAFFWMCLKVKEGEYPPVPPPARQEKGTLRRHFGVMAGYFRLCFSNPYYLSVFLMITLGSLAFGPVNTFAIPYSKSVNMSPDFYGKCLAVTFCISLMLAYVIGWLADRFHPIRICMVATFGYLLVSIWGAQYASTRETFAIGFILHGFFSGTYVTAVASLGPRLFPQSTFAQYSSGAGMILSVCMMTLGPLAGLLIDSTGNNFRYTFAIGAVLCLLALLAAWNVYRQFMKLGGPKGYVAP